MDTVWSKTANVPLQLLEDHSKSFRELAEVDDVPDVLKGEVLALLGPLRHGLHAVEEGRGVHVVAQTAVRVRSDPLHGQVEVRVLAPVLPHRLAYVLAEDETKRGTLGHGRCLRQCALTTIWCFFRQDFFCNPLTVFSLSYPIPCPPPHTLSLAPHPTPPTQLPTSLVL